MKYRNTHRYIALQLRHLTLVSMLAFGFISTPALAESLSPEMQAKVDIYQKKLTQWTKNPVLINALKDVNVKENSKLNNEQWKSLKDQDPSVTSFQTNQAGRFLTNLENDKSIGKIFLRDSKGNLVAGSKKPAIFNIAGRPAYENAMRGKTWVAGNIKPDPTTNLKSVQLSAPVMNDGKVIGVLHSSVIAE